MSAPGDEDVPSSPVAKYLYFNSHFNVLKRRPDADSIPDAADGPEAQTGAMSAVDRAPVTVGIFRVPMTKITHWVESDLANADEIARVKAGDFLMFPVLQSDTKTWNAFQKEFGRPVLVTGNKVLSRTTHLVGMDSRGNLGGYFAKFVGSDRYSVQKGIRSVALSDYVLSGDALLPVDLRDSMMAEFAYAAIKVGGVEIGVIFRSAEAILSVPQGVTAYPAHGLLGCESEIARVASKAGLDVKTWKLQVLMPALARMAANYIFRIGASLESHTQNMVLWIEDETGLIRQIKNLDTPDLLVDMVTRSGRSGNPFGKSSEELKLFSRNLDLFVDVSGAEVAKNTWYHLAIYLGQAIDSHIAGDRNRARMTHTFLKSFIREAGEIWGTSLTLDDESTRVMESLALAEDSRNDFKIGDLYTGETLTERGRFRRAVATVVRSVCKSVRELEITKISQSARLPQSRAEALALKNHFERSLKANRIAFMDENSHDRLVTGFRRDSRWKFIEPMFFMLSWFQRTGKKLQGLSFAQLNGMTVAIDSETGRPIAVGYLPREAANGAGNIKCMDVFR